MYKMIILDDEYLVRKGLSQTIDWANQQITIVGEATNGRDGLELAKKQHPDIIISDVRMPIMDGLEFVKALKETNIDAICIMLSGYKDFEYAKNTLENGAFAYLLKPVNTQKLLEVVASATSELNKRRNDKKLVESVTTDLPLIKSTIIQNLLAGNYQDIGDLKEKNRLYNLNIPIEGNVIYGRIDNAINYQDNSLVKEALEYLYNLIITNLDDKTEGVLYYSHFIILTKTNLSKENYQIMVNKYESKYELLISLGVSSNYHTFEEIYDKYLIAKKLVKNKMLLTLNTISFEDDALNNYRKIVIDIIKYISQNYRFNLDIETISQDLNVSSSHLMHSFKEDVGKTINEYLTEYRMAIAKQLLIQGKYKIYEIAEMVGYTDSKYFSQVFKKTTGYTPVEYITNMR